jgi:hypothetical protein
MGELNRRVGLLVGRANCDHWANCMWIPFTVMIIVLNFFLSSLRRLFIILLGKCTPLLRCSKPLWC